MLPKWLDADWLMVEVPAAAAAMAAAAAAVALMSDEEPPLLRPLELLWPLLLEAPDAAAATAAAVTATDGEAADVTVEAAPVLGGISGSGGWPALRKIRLMDETDGMELGSQTLWARSWSRISHAKRPGLSVLRRKIRLTTDGVATC